MIQCEICKADSLVPASLVIRYWGGSEFRILTCHVCMGAVQGIIENVVVLLGRDKK